MNYHVNCPVHIQTETGSVRESRKSEAVSRSTRQKGKVEFGKDGKDLLISLTVLNSPKIQYKIYLFA